MMERWHFDAKLQEYLANGNQQQHFNCQTLNNRLDWSTADVQHYSTLNNNTELSWHYDPILITPLTDEMKRNSKKKASSSNFPTISLPDDNLLLEVIKFEWLLVWRNQMAEDEMMRMKW